MKALVDSIRDEGFNAKMDFVGRMDRIDEDFAVVAKRIGCTRPLTSTNKGAHHDFREYYVPETRDIVARVYADDIRVFGYEFDDGHASG